MIRPATLPAPASEPTNYREVEADRVATRARHLPRTWCVDPYRGGPDDGAYCSAHAGRTPFAAGAGEHPEGEIVVAVDAPDVLRRELRRPALQGATLAFGTATEPYGPGERRYRLTRRLLAVAAAAGNPVMLITRTTLVTQDAPLLVDLARGSGCAVTLAMTTLDPHLARRLEPGAPPPALRLRAVAVLADAGVPVGITLAPVLPGITDGPGAIERLIAEAAAHGAGWVTASPLWLGDAVAAPLLAAVARDFPDVARRYQRQADAGGVLADIDATRLKVRVATARRRAKPAGGPPPFSPNRPSQLPMDLQVA